jgi:hypothetical protein
MTGWLLALVGAIYLAVAVGYWREGNAGMCLAFGSYSLANLGFILSTWRF